LCALTSFGSISIALSKSASARLSAPLARAELPRLL
jgi:hypothetical protein